MKICVLLRTAGEGVEAKRKRHVLTCFYEGLLAEREEATLHDSPSYQFCDVAVVLGGRSSAKRQATKSTRDDIFARHRGTFVFLETPLIGRQVYRRSALAAYTRKLLRLGRNRYSDEYAYYRVGVDGFLQDDADFNNIESPSDRWQKLARELDLEIKPYRQSGDHILIVGQNPGDASLRGLDIFEWMREVVEISRRHSSRPIVVRPHPVTPQPMLRQYTNLFASLGSVSVDFHPTDTIQAALKGAWVTVTYSSSATVDSLIEGVPCISLSSANIAWPVSDHTLEKIERPTIFAREQWLNDLAYAQWSPGEMQDGSAWRHIRPAVQRNELRPARLALM